MNRRTIRSVAPGRTHSRPERSPAIATDPTSTRWAWLRLCGGGLVLAVLVARVGPGPILDGLRATTAPSLALAAATTALTTVCCARRWQLVAAALGAPIRLGAAVSAVYRAQLLNATLPGGVVGDVDRAVAHARDLGRLGPAVRAVVWERTAGQLVQLVLALGLLLAVPSPLQPHAPLPVAALVVLAAVAVVALAGRSRLVVDDLRAILATARARCTLAATSAVAVLGHLLVFVVACRVTGVDAPVETLLPIGALVLVASALPLNVAGWGPREGVAAWAFATAGLGEGTGLAVAVAYGVMAAVATLSGAVVLLAGRRLGPRLTAPPPVPPRVTREAARA